MPVNLTDVSGTIYPADHLWESAAWDFGITEGGSSGSGLFDANRRLIGQLLGGSSDCNTPGSDVYGKLSKSWTGTGANRRRLSNWLDPGNTGATTLEGKEPGGGGGCTNPTVNLLSVILPFSNKLMSVRQIFLPFRHC